MGFAGRTYIESSEAGKFRIDLYNPLTPSLAEDLLPIPQARLISWLCVLEQLYMSRH